MLWLFENKRPTEGAITYVKRNVNLYLLSLVASQQILFLGLFLLVKTKFLFFQHT
jgi:hypothetical protein